jgi:hypothetical protein
MLLEKPTFFCAESFSVDTGNLLVFIISRTVVLCLYLRTDRSDLWNYSVGDTESSD